MPPLEDLDGQLNSDDERRRYYEATIEEAQHLATKVPCCHVSGGLDEEAMDNFFSMLLHTSWNDLTDGGTETTRAAEEWLELGGHYMYFYMGRAHPQFGDIAMGFEKPEVMDDPPPNYAKGAATPFDTGGFVHGHIEWDSTTYCDRKGLDPSDRKGCMSSFYKECEISFEAMREDFARFLASYFKPIKNYWTDPPTWPDPENIYTLNKKPGEWRPWVFEMHIQNPPCYFEASVYAPSEEILNYVDKLIDDNPNTDKARLFRRFFNSGIPRLVGNPHGTIEPCETLENFILEEIGFI